MLPVAVDAVGGDKAPGEIVQGCREDCAGPAPDAFPATVEGEDAADDDEPVRDPRWSALDELRFE